MQQIGQLINSFATDHSEQVENALSSFSADSQRASQQVAAVSQLVHDTAAASQKGLKVAQLAIISRFVVEKQCCDCEQQHPVEYLNVNMGIFCRKQSGVALGLVSLG